MAVWTYIRGWLELPEALVPAVVNTIESSVADAPLVGVRSSDAEFCNLGWVEPGEPRGVGKTYYFFYGHDVKVQWAPFVRYQMELIAQISATDEDGEVDQSNGVIHIDEEDESNGPPRVWEIKNGRLRERPKPPAV